MNCKHNLDDIISLTEKVLSEEKKSEVIARIKECEICRKAYSILMATESYTLTQPSPAAVDISMKVLEKIDQSRYSKGKVNINAYKLLHKISPALKPLSALAAVVILAITVNWNMPFIKSWIEGLALPRTEIEAGSPKDGGQNQLGSQGTAAAVPVSVLQEGIPDADWFEVSRMELKDVGGKALITVVFYAIRDPERSDSPDDIKAYLMDGEKLFEIGIVGGYGLSNLTTAAQDVNGDGRNELIITGSMGASYSQTIIAGYDPGKSEWLNLLTAGRLWPADLDADGRIELVEGSEGSLPPYVRIYSWTGDAFSVLDVAEATGNGYALVRTYKETAFFESGKIEQGKSNSPKYYKYENGSLTKLSDTEIKLLSDNLEEEVTVRDPKQNDSKNDRALDLDGDGNAESIDFTGTAGGSSYKLKINGIAVEGSANNLQGSYSIVDIDITDRYREIAIGELGPSSDEATYFYRFDGKEIILMGKIQGLAENMLIDGSGYISTSKRGNILHTWFYRADYKVTASHQLEFIPNDQYVMNTKVKVLQPLTLQRSQTNPSPAFTLQTGEEAVIISSDDKEWCLVENSKGQQGWFAVENFFIIKGTGKAAPEFFEGLNFAD